MAVRLRKWNLFTEYDFLWAKFGLTMRGLEWEYFQGPGEIETKEQHFAFSKMLERGRDFRPKEGVNLPMVGYAEEYGHGGPVLNKRNEVGDYILTSNMERIEFHEDGIHLYTVSGSDYLLEGAPRAYTYEQMFRFKNLYLTGKEIQKICSKYFEEVRP